MYMHIRGLEPIEQELKHIQALATYYKGMVEPHSINVRGIQLNITLKTWTSLSLKTYNILMHHIRHMLEY